MTRLCACGCGESLTHSRQKVAQGHHIGACVDCSIAMVTDTTWYKMTQAERVSAKISRHNGHGLCNRCYKAHVRAGTRVGADQRRAEEVLEEWSLLRSDGVTDLTVAAQRMGMSRSALEQALYRARRRGDGRGVVRSNAQLGGIAVGRTGIGRAA